MTLEEFTEELETKLASLTDQELVDALQRAGFEIEN